MRVLSFIVIFLTFSAGVFCASYPTIKSLGTFSTPSPAFLYISNNLPSNSLALFISSFGVSPLKTHGVYVVPNIGSQLSSVGQITPELLAKGGWPNSLSAVPQNIFNEKVLAIPSGFLVPGYTTGSIDLLPSPNPNSTNNNPFKISTDLSGYFYHMLVWRDINGDGLQDILTARATKPIIGTAGGNLLWYEQPAKNALTTPWKESEIISGPDVFFHLYDIDGDGNEELLAAQFFTPGFILYYKPKGASWSNSTLIKSVVIDKTLGAMFDFSFFDINNDGKIDVLATNHVDNANSGVYAYEIPQDYVNGVWTKHVIYNGIKTVAKAEGSASPGIAVPFFPQISNSTKIKPLIVLAGDGAQAAYLISPNTQSPSDWTYNVQTIYSGSSTVGEIAVQDVNGDGFSEIFVPLYDSDEIQVFTFQN